MNLYKVFNGTLGDEGPVHVLVTANNVEEAQMLAREMHGNAKGRESFRTIEYVKLVFEDVTRKLVGPVEG